MSKRGLIVINSVVEVIWVDSKGVTSFWEPIEGIELDTCLCTTVGILVKQDKHTVAVANSICGGDACGVMFIPRCAIQEIGMLARTVGGETGSEA